MTCKHASSGCDYPAGECAGSCLQQSTRETWGHVADLEVECKALRDEIISARDQRRAAHRYIETLLDERAELLEALKLALSSHGVMLMGDPPQDAWKARGVEDKARAAIKKVVGN